MKCARCQHDNPPDQKFCGECGARLVLSCPSCGAANAPTQKFCGECGAGLAATTRGDARTPESYTPRHLAEKILASRSAIEGERKPVTVLFCDVVSSTALAEQLGAEGMHGLLNRFFEAALSEVHRYEGTMNQFLGDGFMALFGAPLAHEDHARRAVLAALGLRRTLNEHPLEAEPGRPVPIQLRFGVHTGFVVVGAIGDNLRMDYTAIGDTTHLAARLQQLAEPGAIVVSDATARLIRGYLRLEPLGPVEVRGRSAPVAIYRVAGAGARRSPLEGLEERPLSSFVGRRRELRLLDDLIADVEAGRGQAVGIVGESGVGKSRLVLEFRRQVAERRITYLEGRCLSFGSAIPYGPVLDIVRTNCGLNEADAPETIIEKVQTALAELGLDHESAPPLLLHLLGVKDGADRLASLSPEVIKARTFETLRQMSVRGSRRRPLILSIEDLHWIDRTSEEYLASLVENLGGTPIMLLATYRPGYRPTWMEKSYATQISLARLASDDSLTIVRSVLPEVGLADPLATLILNKAEGNPFFLEELARAVGERSGSHAALAIPDTVHGVLTARIDRLAELPKRLLQTASILGREFSLRLLEAVWDGGPAGAHLQELTHQEFLYERAAGDEVTYVFKHALTQDVAAATLLAARRRELHRRAGEALAVQYPDRVRELAPILAHYYYQAEAWPLACAHAARAAEAASGAYANREALERYDQAIAAAERAPLAPAERMRLYAARARVHGVLSAFEPARADWETALRLAEAEGDVAMRATLLGELGMLWGGHKDYQQGLGLTQDAVRVAEAVGDRSVLAQALVKMGLMELNVAQMDESRRVLERALAIFGELGDERGRAETLDVLSMVAGIEGRGRESGEYADRALAAFRNLGDRTPEPSLLINRGFWMLYCGERAGEAVIRQGLAAAGALGARSAEAFAHAALGEAGEFFGAFGAGLRECLAGLAIAREIGHLEWTVIGLSLLGRLRRECGDPRGAVAVHEEMLGIARTLGAVIWIADALGELGADRLALGDDAAAAALLDEAISTGGNAVKFVLPALRGRVELLLRRGDAAAALAAARRFQELGRELRIHVVEGRRLEAEALLALHELDAAEIAASAAKVEALTRRAEKAAWRSCLTLADVFSAKGRTQEATCERAEALAALRRVAADLPEDLRAAFDDSPAMRRARV